MEEAKRSLNIKFRYHGFESQFTIRDDEDDWGKVLLIAQAVTRWLEDHGAVPTNGNGNGKHTEEKAPPESTRICPVCQKDDELELITFQRGGKTKQAWKCQRCSKWLPDPK